MQEVIKKEDGASAKNEMLNCENVNVKKEMVAEEHKLFTLPVIKKELENVPQQFVEIKKELDDREDTMELVSKKQYVAVKEENIQMDLLKKIIVKEEKNIVKELVRVCTSEEVSNSEESVITDCKGTQNKIMEQIKIKKEDENLVERLFSEINTVLIKKNLGSESTENKSEILNLINVKKEKNKLVKEFNSEYHQDKVVANNKEAELVKEFNSGYHQNKVIVNNKVAKSKKSGQMDIRKYINIGPRNEMLRHGGGGKQRVRSLIVTVNKSILKPKTYSEDHPGYLRNRGVEDKQITRNNVHDEENCVHKDIININVNRLICREVEKLLFSDERGIQRGKTGVIEQESIKPIEIDSILKKSFPAFEDVGTQNAATLEVETCGEEKSSNISRDQTNKTTEPMECVTLFDSDDDDIISEMGESGSEKNFITNVMDFEFIDCDQEANTERNTDGALQQPGGTSHQVNQMTTADMARWYTNQRMVVHDSDFIRCPPKMCATKGVLNVQNTDKQSFMWSVLAALYPSKHNYRTSVLMPYISKINMCGIDYPVSVKNIDIFEKLNPDISVNVLGYDEEVYPVRMSVCKGRKNHIYLMMLSGPVYNHYCVVTSISRLLSHLSASKHTRFYCKYCFQRFLSNSKHERHVSMCENAPVDVKIIMENLKCKKHTVETFMVECN